MNPKYPNIRVKLIGADGNAFFILGKVIRELRRNKVAENEIQNFQKDATNGDYDNLLSTVMKWVEVE